MLDARAKQIAQSVQHQRGGRLDVDLVQRNPMDLLLAYLVDPDLEAWKRAARSVAAGLAGSASTVMVDQPGLSALVDEGLAGRPADVVAVPQGEAVVAVARATTVHGLDLVLSLGLADPDAERWTALAILPDLTSDVADAAHKARWADWLAWSNVLQFLGLPHESTGTAVAGSSQADTGDHDDLWLRHLAKVGQADESALVGAAGAGGGVGSDASVSPAGGPVELTEEQRESLDFMDDDVAALVGSVLGSGAPELVVGYEADDGHQVEAAFPDRKVGVLLLENDEVPEGWDARPVSGWTVDQLRDALREVD